MIEITCEDICKRTGTSPLSIEKDKCGTNYFNNTYRNMCKRYGIAPLSMEEEAKLPQPVKQTRSNKMDIIDYCDHMAQMIDQIRNCAARIPEDNDNKHADLVQQWKFLVHKANLDLLESANFPYI